MRVTIDIEVNDDGIKLIEDSIKYNKELVDGIRVLRLYSTQSTFDDIIDKYTTE